ncbi:hypothetical protein PM082_009130 [Marasmius tenuissimus]|nr:hypothetical protein PM082_009130 [Marasmius tenuissimus]
MPPAFSLLNEAIRTHQPSAHGTHDPMAQVQQNHLLLRNCGTFFATRSSVSWVLQPSFTFRLILRTSFSRVQPSPYLIFLSITDRRLRGPVEVIEARAGLPASL